MTTIQQARQLVANAVLGIPPDDFDGSPAAYARLSQEQQIRLTEGVARYVASHPEEFSADQLQKANRAIAGESFGTPLEDTSLSAQVEQFGAELGNQAAGIATGFTGKLTSTVALVAGALLLVYFLPAALKSWRKG